jgi:uncharacterized membrane protein
MTQLTESLWGDECFSALAVQKPFGEMINVVMKDTAPPLFYILGAIWGRIFSFSEVSLRTLSFLLILGAALFSALIIYHLEKNKKIAILVGLLALTTPFLEPFAFEWRMYALLTFTIMGSVYFFLKRSWTPYILFTTAALYTHHLALFTLLSQGAWFLISEFNWKKPKTYFPQLKPFLIIAALYLPWLYPMYRQTKMVQSEGFWLSVPTLEELFNLLYKFLTGGVGKTLTLPVTIIAGLLLLFKDWKRIGKSFLELMFVFIGPVLISFAVSYLVTPVFYDRYLLATTVGIATLIGLGIKRYFRFLLLALVILYTIISVNQFTHPQKAPFKDLAKSVKSQLLEGDFLVNHNGKSHHLWESKYYGIPAPIYNPGDPLPFYVGIAQMTNDDTIKALPEAKRIGVISDFGEDISLPNYHQTTSEKFGNLEFSWWEKG